jgi:peptidoglycan-associated lipoprotein
MKALNRSLRIVLPVATALLAFACGSEQVHTTTPGVTAKQPEEPAPAPVSVPNTPTAANVRISEEILRACNIPDADAYFEFDSSRLTSFDTTPLDALAKCFSSGALAGRQMRLVGHADPRGAADYNMTLGQSRADSVATYLHQQGLSRSAMTTTSRGAIDATGRDETGWAHDRRVDVLLGD